MDGHIVGNLQQFSIVSKRENSGKRLSQDPASLKLNMCLNVHTYIS